MSFTEEIKRLRQCSFFAQQDFVNKIGVAFSNVNRWKSERAKQNLKAMKCINTFCLVNNIPYEIIEKAWLDYKVGGKKHDNTI